jgi:DMSO reductase family type II enzyme chaperone
MTLAVSRNGPPATAEAASRSDLYGQLATAISFPDPSFHARARDGRLGEELTASLAGLPFRLRVSDLRWSAPATYDEMQSEYIRLFQIGGRRGPPCPLHAGHYARDRGQALQALIRFYGYFGFGVTECVMPDHLAVQLEFMNELAAGGVTDHASAQRAQGDFLRTHLAWTETLASRVATAGPHPFYRSLTALTARLVAADRRFIGNALGGDRYAGR